MPVNELRITGDSAETRTMTRLAVILVVAALLLTTTVSRTGAASKPTVSTEPTCPYISVAKVKAALGTTDLIDGVVGESHPLSVDGVKTVNTIECRFDDKRTGPSSQWTVTTIRSDGPLPGFVAYLKGIYKAQHQGTDLTGVGKRAVLFHLSVSEVEITVEGAARVADVRVSKLPKADAALIARVTALAKALVG